MENYVAFYKYTDFVDVEVNGRVVLTTDYGTEIQVGDSTYMMNDYEDIVTVKTGESTLVYYDAEVNEFFIEGDPQKVRAV